MITSLIAPSPAISTKSTPTGHRGRRGWAVAAVGAMILGTLIGGMGIASADTSPGTSNSHVVVTTAITLSGLPANFLFTGIPGATILATDAVTMKVLTNNFAGYDVTVSSAATALLPVNPTTFAPILPEVNPDSIPIANLGVLTGATAGVDAASYTSITTSATPYTLVTTGVRSDIGGDTIHSSYQMKIPFVNTGMYSATLDYIATTL